MKNVLILHSGQGFSVDFCKILTEEKCNLHLIANRKIIEILKERGQAILFQSIHCADKFDFNSIVYITESIMHKLDREEVVIVTNSEWCIEVCAKLRAHYKISGDSLELAKLFTNKILMKRKLSKEGICLPHHVLFDQQEYLKDKSTYLDKILNELNFPIFAKPINDANSYHTTKLHGIFDLIKWCEQAKQEISFELDEFIDGTLFHCDTFIKDNKIIYTHVCEYIQPCHKFLEGKPLGSIILPNKNENFIQISEFNELVLSKLGHSRNGITHLEVFKKQNGDLVFLEIASRAGGGLIPKIYKHYLGIDFFEAHYLLQISEKYFPVFSKGDYACWVCFPLDNGIVNKFKLPKLNSKYEIKVNVKLKTAYKKSENLNERAAQLILWNEDYSALCEDFKMLRDFPLIKYINCY